MLLRLRPKNLGVEPIIGVGVKAGAAIIAACNDVQPTCTTRRAASFVCSMVKILHNQMPLLVVICYTDTPKSILIGVNAAVVLQCM